MHEETNHEMTELLRKKVEEERKNVKLKSDGNGSSGGSDFFSIKKFIWVGIALLVLILVLFIIFSS